MRKSGTSCPVILIDCDARLPPNAWGPAGMKYQSPILSSFWRQPGVIEDGWTDRAAAFVSLHGSVHLWLDGTTTLDALQ